MNVPVHRNELGYFLPGTSGNPSGRPKGASEIRELARQYVPAALVRISELVRSQDERVALAAAQEILNRVFGKALQSIESVEGNDTQILNIGALYLQAVQAANRQPDPRIVVDLDQTEHHPADRADDAW
jgi:hypothetical protein